MEERNSWKSPEPEHLGPDFWKVMIVLAIIGVILGDIIISYWPQ